MSTNTDLVNAIIAENWASAEKIALELAATVADKVDKSVGDLRLSLSQKHTHYLQVASRMRQKVALTAVPFAGGISVADRNGRTANNDRVDPAFARDLHSNTVSDDD